MSANFKYYILIIYLFLTLKLLNGTRFNYWPKEFEQTQNLSQALTEIVKIRFVQESHQKDFNFLVQVELENEKYLDFFDEIIDETSSLLGDSISIRLGYDVPIPSHHGRHFSILLVDSKNSLEFLYQNLRKYHLFIEGSFFIVLQTFPHPNHYYDELVKIMDLNKQNGLTHADVLVYAVENLILLFQFMPFTPYHCKGNVPVVHNKFINGHWLSTQFFVSKALNLYGCPLVCGTWEDMPYFKMGSRSTKSQPIYEGIEGKLLEYLSTKMNFTVTMRWLNDEEINQTIYDEQGVFNKLFESGTDFVIGAFHYKPTSLEDPYAPTSAYYMSNYYFILSSKTDQYDPFTKLLLPFDSNIWIILISSFAFGNAIIFLVTYLDRQLKHLVLGRDNNTPSYNMLIISLGGTVTKDPKIPFSRFLLMLWLLATFVLRVVYQSFLFHFIRTDIRRPPPKGIFDLLTDEYRILMSDVTFSIVTDLARLYRKAEILNTSEVEAFEMLRHPEDYKPYKLAILTAQEYFAFYKIITPINNDFYVIPEKLFTQQLTIYMRKNSEYISKFNSYIKNYIYNGLMSRSEKLLHYGFRLGSYRGSSDDSPKPMRLYNLYGAFRLLFSGLIGSLLVFFIEISVHLLTMCYRGLMRTARRVFKRNHRQI